MILKSVVLVVINTPIKMWGIILPVQLMYKYWVARPISEMDVIFRSSPATTRA